MATALRARYVADAVETTSPVRLVTMLYDRLVADLNRAEAGFGPGGDVVAARRALEHALDVLTELRASLDVTKWDGGPGLASLYAFAMAEVIGASIASDPGRVAVVRGLVEPLRDAWHVAATKVLSGQA